MEPCSRGYGCALRRLLLVSAVLLGGCGIAISRGRLKRHFKQDFVCPKAEVHTWRDGYRVEGCSVAAFYWCDDGRGGTRARPARRHEWTRTKAVEGAVVGIFKLGWAGESCLLDHHYTGGLALAPDAGPDVKDVMAEVDRAYFRATARFEGGHVESWAPRKLRAYTLLKLYGDEPFSMADGAIQFAREGRPLHVFAMQQVQDNEAHFLVESEELNGLALMAYGASYELSPRRWCWSPSSPRRRPRSTSCFSCTRTTSANSCRCR